MNDITKQLNARPPKIQHAPLRFDGRFEDFFELYVVPNLPSKERVLEFDERIEYYLSSSRPYHLVRQVANLDRRKTHHTADGNYLLASDNSPNWWLHAFLLSDFPFPSNMGEFLFDIPRHFHDIKLANDMNKAGFYLAHLSNAKNGDTKWNIWKKEELERRTRLNIHPWNWSLIASEDGQKHGADKNIIGFLDHAYTKFYGDPYQKWRLQFPLGFIWDGVMIPYSCGVPTKYEGSKIKAVATGMYIQKLRPIIQCQWIGKEVTLNLRLLSGNYQIAHDDLLQWVRFNTNALKTTSWIQGGAYHWPKPSKKMAEFLESFRVL